MKIASVRPKVEASFDLPAEEQFLLEIILLGQHASDQGLLGEVQADDPGSRESGWSFHNDNLRNKINGQLGSFMK